MGRRSKPLAALRIRPHRVCRQIRFSPRLRPPPSFRFSPDDSDVTSSATGDDTHDSNLEETTGPDADASFRAIEKFFPSEAVSQRSRTERYQRGRTPHTIFTWWARRPFAAASAVATTSLIECTSLNDRARELVDEYVRSDEAGLLRVALEPLTNAEDQKVLDLFGGGGTIPLEAARMGAEVHAVENNELAHFAQTAILRLSQSTSDLSQMVREAGEQLLEELADKTEAFFPARDAGDQGRTIAYLWTREVQCPGCDGWLSLMRRPWLSKRSDRHWFIERTPQYDRGVYSVQLRNSGQPDDDHCAWDGNEIECPFCDHRIERAQIGDVAQRRCRDRMVAVCTSTGRASKSKKQFAVADPEHHFPSAKLLEEAIADDLEALDAEMPAAQLPRWSGVTNPTLYGMAEHAELFNLRQRAVLIRLCLLLEQHHGQWSAEWGEETARVVTAFLSGLIDQLADWNGRLATWISQNEQIGRGLSGPGMAMVWDHAEIDPIEEAPANLWDKLDRICRGIESIPQFNKLPETVRADARSLPYDDQHFDVIATDPPYFDNVFYSVLADCIYVWKRLALGEIFPEYFEAQTTDSSRELTMNRHVHGDPDEAARYYTEGMQQVLDESRRVLKDRGVVSMIFAHGTVDGWASIVEAIRGADLQLVAAWPMYVERRDRPRAMGSRAVNTSFVLVARKRRDQLETLRWSRFETMLRSRLDSEDGALEIDEHYGPDTRGRTLFGLGISSYSRAGRIVDGGDELSAAEVIARIADIVDEMLGDDSWGAIRR